MSSDIRLLISWWAPTLKYAPHLREVEAAIVLNLSNKHLAVVHLILETTPEYRCSAVEKRFAESFSKTKLRQAARLECEEHTSSKLTYFDMFTTAKSLNHFENTIVILANADMVFDSSVRHFAEMSSNVLGIVSTSGFRLDDGQQDLQALYGKIVGKQIGPAPDRCYELKVYECRGSWDAFAFHPSRLRLNAEAFLDGRSGKPFVMYQNGAEAAALNALLNQSTFSKVYQFCDYVKMWHFHSEEKTHFQSSESFVVHHYSWPAECHVLRECLNLPVSLSQVVGSVESRSQRRCEEINAPFMHELLKV